jgi:hypothetical protein
MMKEPRDEGLVVGVLVDVIGIGALRRPYLRDRWVIRTTLMDTT